MKTRPSTRDQRKATTGSQGFERYDGLKFAVVAPQFNWGPLRGIARFERDDMLGSILRIPIEGSGPGKPEIVLAEEDWNGLITEDSQYGCQYCVTLLAETD